jgi:hypothetical protein
MQRIEVGTAYSTQAPADDIQKVLMSVLETFEESCGLKIARGKPPRCAQGMEWENKLKGTSSMN